MKKTKQKNLIKWLKDCDKTDLPKVGGKNASLGEMINADIPVPPGFALTIESYKETLEESGITKTIQNSLVGLDLHDPTSIGKTSQYLRGLIEAERIPSPVERKVMEYYEELCRGYDIIDLPVAVRSSATAEDLPEASFAGQHDSYLWIRGDDLTSAIKRCWSSLFTARAIAYRMRMGFPHEKVFISVGVQKMVNAKAAGVMFTINPLNGDRSKIMIQGNWGLGESVVSGSVTPDEWMVDKVVLEIIRRTVSEKGVEHIVDDRSVKVITSDIPPDRQNVPCLTDEEVIELAKLGKRIEQQYGLPQDVEWSIDKDLPFPQNIHVVQSRPETIWSKEKKEAKLKSTGSATKDVVEFWLNIKG
jgi:pyruvate,water dikinase